MCRPVMIKYSPLKSKTGESSKVSSSVSHSPVLHPFKSGKEEELTNSLLFGQHANLSGWNSSLKAANISFQGFVCFILELNLPRKKIAVSEVQKKYYGSGVQLF